MAIFVLFSNLTLSCIHSFRRKEREQKKSAKAQKGKSSAKKRGAATKPKSEPPKKKEKAQKKKIIEEEEEEGEEVEHDETEKDVAPDTSGDAALAESMSGKRVSTRNLDAKGDKFKKAAALAKIREVRCEFPLLFLFYLVKSII